MFLLFKNKITEGAFPTVFLKKKNTWQTTSSSSLVPTNKKMQGLGMKNPETGA
jgi:hypothetical protein